MEVRVSSGRGRVSCFDEEGVVDGRGSQRRGGSHGAYLVVRDRVLVSLIHLGESMGGRE